MHYRQRESKKNIRLKGLQYFDLSVSDIAGLSFLGDLI